MSTYYEQVIEAAYLHSRPNCYFVGPYARRVSFASQQHRALDLISALHQKKRLEGRSIAIVGAGVAGVTAAAALRGLGHGVDIYEAEPEALTVQQQATHRIIHPTISRWPAEKLEISTKFSLLDWPTAPCSRVIARLREQWDAYIKPTPEEQEQDYRFFPGHKIKEIVCNPDEEVTFAVEAGPNPPHYQLAIITTGFGAEIEVPGAYNISYWTPDELDEWRRSKKQLTVSGCGDGGLIDALRLIHGNFADGRLTLELAHILDQHTTIKDRIAEAEERALLAAKSIKCIAPSPANAPTDRQVGEAADDYSVVAPLSKFYQDLARELPEDAVNLLTQSYTASGCSRAQVKLVSLQSKAFGPYAAPIHKLMVAHAMACSFVTYETRDVGKPANKQKSGKKAKTAEGEVIVRHGAKSNLEGLLKTWERESLRIRQFLLADYIDKKEEYNYPRPPRAPQTAPARVAAVHSMANELVAWMKTGATITAREDCFHLDGDCLAECTLGIPSSLFGIPVKAGDRYQVDFY